MIITTRFISPTDTRGARITATFPRKLRNSDTRNFSVTIPYPHSLSGDNTHMEAAQMLVAKWNRAAIDYSASIGQGAEYANTITGTFHCVDSTGDTCTFARVEKFAVAFNAESTAGMESEPFERVLSRSPEFGNPDRYTDDTA